jgi:hypothetical protein
LFNSSDWRYRIIRPQVVDLLAKQGDPELLADVLHDAYIVDQAVCVGKQSLKVVKQKNIEYNLIRRK